MTGFRIATAAFLAVALSAGTTDAANPPSANGSGGCDINYAEAQDAARDAYIAGQVALADANFSKRPDNFAVLSCLERLMNSGGDIFFSPPSLGDLMGMLEDFVCNQAESVFQEATAPLNQAINQRTQVGEVIPGVNLGSINSGVRVRVRSGMDGGPGSVTTNLNRVLRTDQAIGVSGSQVRIPDGTSMNEIFQ